MIKGVAAIKEDDAGNVVAAGAGGAKFNHLRKSEQRRGKSASISYLGIIVRPEGRQAASKVNARATQRLSLNWSRNSGRGEIARNLVKFQERSLKGGQKYVPYF